MNETRFLRTIGATGGWLLALGWAIGGLVLVSGNIILWSGHPGPPASPELPFPLSPDLQFRLGWSMVFLANLIFVFSDFGLILAFTSFGMLFAEGNRFYRIFLATVFVWMGIAVTVDTVAAATAWIYGLLGDGINPAKAYEVVAWYNMHVLNLIRIPVRAMYFFMGLAMFLFAWMATENHWPAGLRRAAKFFGVILLCEVGAQILVIVFGKSPTGLTFFGLNFFVAAPWFGIQLARAFREKSA